MKIDEVGYWSELKLEIIKKYASAYSQILATQKLSLQHHYIDAFAGAGIHVAKRTGEFILGSPLNALNISPPFKHHHLIDLDGERVEHLREITKDRKDVTVHEGDCNGVLLDEVFPKVRYEDYHRALCILDPYKLNPDWAVVAKAGEMKSVEIFLNFMVMDMNMNVLWKNPNAVMPTQIERMNRFWGDDSWRSAAYRLAPDLFGSHEEKTSNEDIAEAYRKRLKDVAKFKYVPQPLPMRNSGGAIIYYLFFASPNANGAKIVEDIFNSYRKRGVH
ncbi:MAG TPA: three-Cys-motif partner protein TcmP [Chthoniobacterales bacterium]|nr:three-Cys-motif partner protein TcmP [Chthoniobacterales bacterium]